MDEDYSHDLYTDKNYRIRYARSLFEQIKRDYADFIRLRETLKNRQINRSQMEELQKKLCWINKSISEVRKMQHKGIEGVLWAEINYIQRDIKDRQNFLIASVFKAMKHN